VHRAIVHYDGFAWSSRVEFWFVERSWIIDRIIHFVHFRNGRYLFLLHWYFVIIWADIFHFIITFVNLRKVRNTFTKQIILIRFLHWLSRLVCNPTFFRTVGNFGAHVVSTWKVSRKFLNYFLSDIFHRLFIVALIKDFNWI